MDLQCIYYPNAPTSLPLFHEKAPFTLDSQQSLSRSGGLPGDTVFSSPYNWSLHSSVARGAQSDAARHTVLPRTKEKKERRRKEIRGKTISLKAEQSELRRLAHGSSKDSHTSSLKQQLAASASLFADPPSHHISPLPYLPSTLPSLVGRTRTLLGLSTSCLPFHYIFLSVVSVGGLLPQFLVYCFCHFLIISLRITFYYVLTC